MRRFGALYETFGAVIANSFSPRSVFLPNARRRPETRANEHTITALPYVLFAHKASFRQAVCHLRLLGWPISNPGGKGACRSTQIISQISHAFFNQHPPNGNEAFPIRIFGPLRLSL